MKVLLYSCNDVLSTAEIVGRWVVGRWWRMNVEGVKGSGLGAADLLHGAEPSWEANSRLSSQDIPQFSMETDSHYCVHKSPPTDWLTN